MTYKLLVDVCVFQDVITKLKACEMKNKINPNTIQNVKKPYWYYLLKFKQKLRQKFPEKWHYDQ